MSAHSNDMARIRAVQDKYSAQLLKKRQVIGVSIGRFNTHVGQSSDRLALIVLVGRKLPVHKLTPEDVIPHELDGVPVVVREVGSLEALQRTALDLYKSMEGDWHGQ